MRALPDVVRAIEHFDPSLVRSAVPNFLLAEMTAQHVKVVLTGEGADELFAGYEYLRGFDSAESLQAELMRTVHGLHNLNLQRCDRVTMAHGLEARVPFLDRQVIAFAFGLPMAWKLSAPGELEKRLLRRAFERLAARRDPVAREGRVRRRQRRQGRADAARSRTASARPTSSASATRSTRRCARARSSPTTASSPSTCPASARSGRSGASRRRSRSEAPSAARAAPLPGSAASRTQSSGMSACFWATIATYSSASPATETRCV